MKRRAFLSALSGGLLAAPLAGEGQQAASLPRIGFLAPASLSDPRVLPYIRAFQESGQSRQRIAGQAQDAARTLGVRLQPLWARDLSEIDSAFTATRMERADALIVLTDTMLINHRTRVIDHAGQRRLPAVFGVSQFVEAGGLLA